MNVVKIGKPNLQDIPAMLRELADMCEKNGNVKAIALVIETDGEDEKEMYTAGYGENSVDHMYYLFGRGKRLLEDN